MDGHNQNLHITVPSPNLAFLCRNLDYKPYSIKTGELHILDYSFTFIYFRVIPFAIAYRILN